MKTASPFLNQRRRTAFPLLAAGLFAFASVSRLCAADATLTPTVDFYTTSAGNVASLTNRLLSNINQQLFLEFNVASIDLDAVTSATLRLYLVQDSANTQGSRDIIAQTCTFTAVPVEGSAFTYTPGTGEGATTSVDSTAASQYWNWDVTALLVPENVTQNNTISFVMTMTGQAAVFRFTDSDPANDNSPANTGSPLQLLVTTTAVPEPAATAIIAACIALGVFWVARRRRNG
ncbi:MAG: hypothetical protein LBK99_17905 [Opitutaceae bacterium]|jgi:hypothetical protein|nr:hypothetical protein [Opitutaceae bacterium]